MSVSAGTAAAWPLAACLAVALAAERRRGRRRRRRLNRGLHELRRPLQRLLLAGGGSTDAALVRAALADLDSAVNGVAQAALCAGAATSSRLRLTQALDNLVTNALEHGEGAVRILVHNPTGSATAPQRDRERHGHGLEVVREIARAHGGSFSLERNARSACAVLELPSTPDWPAAV